MKTTKKLLSAVLAVAMLLCMATTAFAATPIDISDSGASVAKTWTAASLSQLNDTEVFEFELTYTGATEVNGSIATAAPQLNSSDMTSKTVTITADWLAQATDADPSADGSISFEELFSGITFSAPGVYTFDLTEVTGTNANIDYSDASYTITVVVGYALDETGSPKDELSIVSVTTADVVGEKVAPTFENDPAANEALTVSKTVKGTAANVDDYFAFTVTLTSGATGTYAVTVGSHVDNPATIEAGVATTIYLKHGESFTIENLPLGAAYTVTEASNTYDTTSVVVNSGTETETNTVSGEIAEGGNTCAFTNTKDVPTITGYLMDILPFALLIGIALLGAVVFLVIRRRRREEY